MDPSRFVSLLETMNPPVGMEEVAQRAPLVLKRLKGIPFTPEETAWWSGPQRGGQMAADFQQGFVQGLANAAQTQGWQPTKPTMSSVLQAMGAPPLPPVESKNTGDPVGDMLRYVVSGTLSPYAAMLLKLVVFFVFFLSQIERTPILGSVLSASLDLTLAGGRSVVKIAQKGIPALMGLLPIPYAHLTGVAIASVVGLFVWTILATISFGRQDFTSAIDSMLRIIPMPIGDAIADTFLEVNRTLGQLNTKRIKLTDDVWNGLLAVQSFVAQMSQYVEGTVGALLSRASSGATTMLTTIAGPVQPPPPVQPPVPMAQPIPEPIPEPVPIAQPVPQPIPEPVPMAQPVPEPVPQPIPMAPPPSAPPVPEPVPPPVPQPPPPQAIPVQPPVPQPPPPVTETRMAEPPVSALERLRSRKTDFTAPKQLRGGKRLSTKTRRSQKWMTRLLSARFSGAGLR